MYFFEAEVYKSGYNYLVDLPTGICEKFNKGGYIPVRGVVKNEPFKSSLAPRQGEKFVMFLNSEIRKKAQISESDFVNIEIECDPESRDIEIAEDVEQILKETQECWQKFISMSPAHRRELLLWIYDAKQIETRLRRIKKAIHHISKRKKVNNS